MIFKRVILTGLHWILKKLLRRIAREPITVQIAYKKAIVYGTKAACDRLCAKLKDDFKCESEPTALEALGLHGIYKVTIHL